MARPLVVLVALASLVSVRAIAQQALRPTPPQHRMNPFIAHVEVPADDPKRSADFYAELFGWAFDLLPDESGSPGYWLATAGAQPQAITLGVDERERPEDQPIFTVYVDDIDEYLRRVVSLGGSVTVPKFSIPEAGWLAYVEDPDSNHFAIFEADDAAR